jgi:hypothetical protein
MQRFFLHIRNGADSTNDIEGSILPNVEAAGQLAIECARELMAEAVAHGDRVGLNRVFDIKDEVGTLLLTVSFRDAIDLSDAA